MVRTYVKTFFGDPRAVEQAVKKFDQIFRQWYNVYGGQRQDSGVDSDGNYEVVMYYTADWGTFNGLMPEYSMAGLEHAFDRATNRRPYNEDFWCGKAIDINTGRA